MLPLPSLLRRPTEQLPPPPPVDDMALLDGGMVFDDEGNLEYYWFHLQHNGQTFYKAVILHALTFLPRETREQMTVLHKMQKVLRGLWNSGVDLIYLAAGIFPEPGIVQCYGSQGVGQSREKAWAQALPSTISLLAAMANYEQAQLEPLSVQVATRLRQTLTDMNFATTVIGHPDPREGSRGMTSAEGPTQQLGLVGLQQNEMLMRGFARAREPFLEVVMATPVSMRDITRLQERVAHEAGIWASKVRFTRSISAGVSIPMILSGSNMTSASQSYGVSEGYGVSDAVGEARSISHGVADQVSEGHGVTDSVGQNWASASSQGVSEVITRGRSHTVGFSDGISEAHAVGGSETHGAAHTEGQAVSQGVAHTEGQAFTQGQAHSEGQAASVGSAHSEGAAVSHSDSVGGAENWSTAQGQSQSHGAADTNSWGRSHSESSGVAHSRGETAGESWSHTDSVADSTVHSRGTAHTEGQSHQEGGSWNVGASASAGVQGSLAPGGVGVGASGGVGVSGGVGGSWSDTSMSSTTVSESASQGHTVGHADTVGGSHSVSTGVSRSQGVSDGVTSGGSHSVSDTVGASLTQSQGGGRSWGASDGLSHSVADSVSQSATRSSGDTLSQSATRSAADTVSRSATRSAADTVSHAVSSNWSDTQGKSHSDSVADGVTESISLGRSASSSRSAGGSVGHSESHTQGQSHTVSDGVSDTSSRQHGANHSVGSTLGQSLGWARGLGMSAGLAPSLSISKSYAGEDHVAALVAGALGQQELILQTMSLEGALMVDHYILTATPEGRQIAETLVPQAFHGVEEVATPVRTRRLTPQDEAYIRARATLFTPSTRPERSPWALQPWADSSLLTMMQAATYVAPGAFEQGLAVTTQERIPPFAFRADIEGDVLLGHFISYETAQLTAAALRLSRERMANWLFAGDTGSGKSVSAERLVLETTRLWRIRTVVEDFGAGWRRLLSVLPDHCTIYGLYPGSARPIRWNPLQIGRRITPELQLAATCELLVNAGRMGQRQHGWLRQFMRMLYAEHGVLVEDREMWADAKWGQVQDAERQLLNQARSGKGLGPLPAGDVPLSHLAPWERQLLAVERSKAVDLLLLYGRLNEQFTKLRSGSPDHTSMQGLLLRLEAFTQGQTARMYGRGEGSIAVEDFSLPWGITILEGGQMMDEYAKAVILGLVSWHLYTDAVIRREQSIGDPASNTPMHIVFEEANKVLSGVGGEEDPRQGSTSAIFENMFRDARKYAIYLSAIVQSPALLAPGILSSCNNMVVGQLKGEMDRKAILAMLARMVTGFHDQDYVRYIGRMPQATMIAKLGASQRSRDLEPMLFRPLMVPAREPTNADIAMLYGDSLLGGLP